MSKRTFVTYGLLIAFLAVLIPWLAFRSDGDPAATAEVPANLEHAQSVFRTNCGTCHALFAAGSSGNFGPNLDELLAPTGLPEGPGAEETIETTEGRVLNAIVEGVETPATPRRMPGGILSGEQARAVSEFVARTAGQR